MNIEQILKDRLLATEGKADIPKYGGTFSAKLAEDGVVVDNLGHNEKNSLLVWAVFTETMALLEELGGEAKRGNVRKPGARLGDADIPLDSIEGRVAKNVYEIAEGTSVFMRITPIANILVWLGVCEHGKGVLKLVKK